MKVLVAMSGGVDSSVAAALLVEEGHEVEGATLKLWGGPSDSGCCSVTDVDDARRVSLRLGITHHVFNMSEQFDNSVVEPYVDAHRRGFTPNPCIECNRFIKFDALVEKARRLGFDALATGHYARVDVSGDIAHLLRGHDQSKDQSYVLSMLGQDQLRYLRLPIGSLEKSAVREKAANLGLVTASKPDSQDVCFIESTGGRSRFLAERIELHPGAVVAADSGVHLGEVPAIELVTIGQRRGLPPLGRRHYVVGVDHEAKVVEVAPVEKALADRVSLDSSTLTWVDRPAGDGDVVHAQVSAHGRPRKATIMFADHRGHPTVVFERPAAPIAPGQTVALYDGIEGSVVVGSGIAMRSSGR